MSYSNRNFKPNNLYNSASADKNFYSYAASRRGGSFSGRYSTWEPEINDVNNEYYYNDPPMGDNSAGNIFHNDLSKKGPQPPSEQQHVYGSYRASNYDAPLPQTWNEPPQPQYEHAAINNEGENRQNYGYFTSNWSNKKNVSNPFNWVNKDSFDRSNVSGNYDVFEPMMPAGSNNNNNSLKRQLSPNSSYNTRDYPEGNLNIPFPNLIDKSNKAFPPKPPPPVVMPPRPVDPRLKKTLIPFPNASQPSFNQTDGRMFDNGGVFRRGYPKPNFRGSIFQHERNYKMIENEINMLEGDRLAINNDVNNVMRDMEVAPLNKVQNLSTILLNLNSKAMFVESRLKEANSDLVSVRDRLDVMRDRFKGREIESWGYWNESGEEGKRRRSFSRDYNKQKGNFRGRSRSPRQTRRRSLDTHRNNNNKGGIGNHNNVPPPDPTVHYTFNETPDYYCVICSEKCIRLSFFLDHLRSAKHLQNNSKKVPPWRTEAPKALPQHTSTKIERMKGAEFMSAADGFYCELCQEFLGDSVEASHHLKGYWHNAHYEFHVKTYKNYESIRFHLRKKAEGKGKDVKSKEGEDVPVESGNIGSPAVVEDIEIDLTLEDDIAKNDNDTSKMDVVLEDATPNTEAIEVEGNELEEKVEECVEVFCIEDDDNEIAATVTTTMEGEGSNSPEKGVSPTKKVSTSTTFLESVFESDSDDEVQAVPLKTPVTSSSAVSTGVRGQPVERIVIEDDTA